jgi:hypothetical protein
LDKDLVFTYRSARLIKKLAERAGPRLRVVDGKAAYWRLAGEDPAALFKSLATILDTSA